MIDKERFLTYICPDADTGCWDWIGACTGGGYGAFRVGLKTRPAHRVAFELFVGPIPDGMQVLHSCDNPKCVNPRHLRAGTQSDNVKEAFDKGRVTNEGVNHSQHILTEKDVVAIRNSEEPQTVLADRYGVARTTISSVQIGKSWRHVK